MLGPHFYNEAIRKTVIAFGTLFNNIEIRKFDPDTGDVIESEKVPLAYGPKNKFLVQLEENTANKKVTITLPRMYFEMTGLEYDTSRKTSSINKIKAVINDNGQELRTQYVPVPYDMIFDVGILAKSQDDGLQILEQILPYFQPALNISVNFIPDMEESRDISCVLNSIDYIDDWTDDFMQRRSITWSLRFTVKSYIYGPYNKADVIRKARIIETIGDLNVNKRNSELSYTPKALEDKNNDGVINSVDDALITADDDFGFNEGITLL
jgi:hypothetical protein